MLALRSEVARSERCCTGVVKSCFYVEGGQKACAAVDERRFSIYALNEASSRLSVWRPTAMINYLIHTCATCFGVVFSVDIDIVMEWAQQV